MNGRLHSIPPTGNYEHLLVPFPLTYTLIVFQALVNMLFRHLIFFVFIYLDDSLMFSPSLEEQTPHAGPSTITGEHTICKSREL